MGLVSGGVMGSYVVRRLRPLLVLCGVLAVAGAGYGGRLDLTSSEAMAAVAVLVGLVVAFGVLEPIRRSSGPTLGARPTDLATSAGAERVLDALDPIAHRRLDIGMTWPQLLVGPCGVAIVAVCPLDGPLELRADGVFDATNGSSCPGCGDSSDVAMAVREALGTSAVPIRRFAVVPAGATVSGEVACSGDITALSVSQLADALARGPVLSMDTVDAVFTRLARSVTGNPRPLSSR